MTAVIDRPRPGTRLTTGGVIRSEWIKLFTLRSTWWCLALLAAMLIGASTLISLVLSMNLGGEEGATAEGAAYTWTLANTVLLGMIALVAPVIGSLTITGEYGTGMIRSSFAAAPGRVSTVLAKALVTGGVVFAVSAVSLAISAFASGAILSAGGYPIDFGDAGVWLALLGAAGYPALLAVMSVGVGALLRNSAGTIATVLGLLLVIPTILPLAGFLLQAQWITDVNTLLPSSLGTTMSSYPMDDMMIPATGLVLEPWQAALALAAWAVVPLIAGTALVKRRDV